MITLTDFRSGCVGILLGAGHTLGSLRFREFWSPRSKIRVQLDATYILKQNSQLQNIWKMKFQTVAKSGIYTT